MLPSRDSYDAKLEEIRNSQQAEPSAEERDEHDRQVTKQRFTSFAIYSAMVGAS